MSFRKILAGGSFALDKVRDCIQAQRVDSHIQPVAQDLEHLLDDSGIVEVQVWLVRKKTVPVVLFGDRVPSPIRSFGVREDDTRVFVLLFGVAPDIKVAFRRTARSLPGCLEPRMLVGGMIYDQLDHDLQIAIVSRCQKTTEIVEGAIYWMDVQVIGDIVAVILKWRRKERQ